MCLVRACKTGFEARAIALKLSTHITVLASLLRPHSHIARYCRSKNKPVESHVVITSGASSEEEEWDMEALAVLSDRELESHGSAVIEEEDWKFDNSMLITEDEEGNIIEET